MSIFSDNLRTLRKDKELSAEVVAVNCKISHSTYRRYETGEREPSLSVAYTLADFYGVTLDQLSGRAPLPENPDKGT